MSVMSRRQPQKSTRSRGGAFRSTRRAAAAAVEAAAAASAASASNVLPPSPPPREEAEYESSSSAITSTWHTHIFPGRRRGCRRDGLLLSWAVVLVRACSDGAARRYHGEITGLRQAQLPNSPDF